jgi:hypothetical protein
MSTETMTDAQRVAVDHADTLETFGGWLDMFGDGASRSDVERVADDDDADADDRAAARAALAWIDENGADDLSWSAFVADVLDIEIGGRFDSDSGEWYVTDVAALISYGGPTVRYHVHGAGTIRVSVAWWNDHADRVIDSGLADYLDAYADDVAGSR